MKPVLPQLAERLLRNFLKADLIEEVLGDLEEKFVSTAKQGSLVKAKLNYWFQMINYLRPFAIQNARSYYSIYFSMYRNNFKIGYRNLLRNKGYSSINTGGLAVGMAVAMFIGLWVHDELTFNRYHENHDRIAQVMQHQKINDEIGTLPALPIPLKAELLSKHGDDFDNIVLAFWPQNLIISHKDTKLTTLGNFIGNDVISMFSLNMLEGGNNALIEPGSIIISETLSQMIFDGKDPIGKMMKIDNEMNVMVTGVYEDLPKNSSLYGITFIAPWKLWETSQDWVRKSASENDWNDNSYQLYAMLSQHADMQQVSAKIKMAKFNNINEGEKAQSPEIFLHPMNDWHLKSAWENGVQTGGLIQFVNLFSIIGALVLVLACINFMNLSTAQSERRSKEVGIRKAIGSLRGQLMNQFLTESFLVVVLAFVLALCTISLTMPFFNTLVVKNIKIPFSNIYFWFICIGFIVGTALLAGSYPAFYLSSFRPITVLKGTFKAGKSAMVFRKALVVIQFTASIALIIGTLLVQKQIQYAKNRPMGFDTNGTIMVWSNSPGFHGKFELLRNELKDRDAIVEMSESSSPLTQIFGHINSLNWEGKDPGYAVNFGMIAVTPEYGKTIGWEIHQGRDFSRNFASDSLALILNKKAVQEMGLIDPIGMVIKSSDDQYAKKYHVIGVINDILVQSPFDKITPIIYTMSNNSMNCMTIKLNPNKGIATSLSVIEDVFNKHIPSVPFDYRFTDQVHGLKFAAEERIGTLSGIFAVIAIFISGLGIFGMASFVAEKRTKEIGIRKILGAPIFSIWKMMAQSFVVLVVYSSFIAIPIAYFTLDSWLNGFEYRTSIHWPVFAIAGLGAVIITLLTVSYHALSAAFSNPLKSLRFE
ncbi:ABC transporter permease [Candidatus Bathyarchaeota archaeon]|nr:ABC transporter permease [Candidatus Bathyarchaeota archaeon]